MKTFALLAGLLLLSACAMEKKGILLDVEPATPLDQRDLHKHCDLGDSAACTLSTPILSESFPAKIPIVQGIAPEDRAVFSALVPKGKATLWFLYERDLGRLWKLNSTRLQSKANSAWAVHRVEVRNLDPGRTYELLAGDSEGNLLEDRSFRTLSSAGNALRFAIVSGLRRGSTANADRILTAARSKNPQLILFLGDNVDVTSTREQIPAKANLAFDHFFERHAQARENLGFAREKMLVPIAAVWDESEFGSIAGDRTFVFKDQAREVFEMFFPHLADEVSLVDGPGISQSLLIGGQMLALLDTRTFRKPTGRFGTLQSNWLLRQVTRAKRPVWVLAGSSSLHYGAYVASGTPPPDTLAWMNHLESRLFTDPKKSEPVLSGAAFSLIEAKVNGQTSEAKRLDFDSSGAQKSNRVLDPL